MHTLRKRLQDGEVIIGSWINSASGIIAELMASSGFDFLAIDAEHSAVDLPQVQRLFQAMRSGNPDCACFVRAQCCDYIEIRRYMDAGAGGVICPMINSAEEAQMAVDAVKYPPLGKRGVGFCRDNMYGTRLQKRVEAANDDTVVCVQIEHVDGVKNVEEILSVDGVDAAFIGPYDLTASMGITGELDHPDFITAKRVVLDACRQHGVVAGIHVVQPDVEEARSVIDSGYGLVAYSLDITMISSACAGAMRELRGN